MIVKGMVLRVRLLPLGAPSIQTPHVSQRPHRERSIVQHPGFVLQIPQRYSPADWPVVPSEAWRAGTTRLLFDEPGAVAPARMSATLSISRASLFPLGFATR